MAHREWCYMNVTANSRCSNDYNLLQSPAQPKGVVPAQGELFSYTEYPEVAANVVGPSTTPSKTKGKQLIVSSDESDTEPEGVYWHTRTRTGIIAPVNFSALAQGIEVSESHSAIAESVSYTHLTLPTKRIV